LQKCCDYRSILRKCEKIYLLLKPSEEKKQLKYIYNILGENKRNRLCIRQPRFVLIASYSPNKGLYVGSQRLGGTCCWAWWQEYMVIVAASGDEG
jgi:hypothetical protein